jgi:hypothetical protein
MEDEQGEASVERLLDEALRPASSSIFNKVDMWYISAETGRGNVEILAHVGSDSGFDLKRQVYGVPPTQHTFIYCIKEPLKNDDHSGRRMVV